MARDRTIDKKGSFLGKLFLFLIAFILGIATAVGGIVGAGYYISTKKTAKEVLSLFRLDYSSYISEEYAEKTVLDAVKSMYNDIMALADPKTSINDLGKISPYIEEKVSDMVRDYTAQMYDSFGIQLNQDDVLLSLPFSELGAHIKTALEDTPVLEIVTHFGEGNKIIEALCYGIEGKDYVYNDKGEIEFLEGHHPLTIGEFSKVDLHERIDGLPIDLFVDINPDDAMMCSIAYGHEHRYKVVVVDGVKTIEMEQAYYLFDGGKFYDDYKKELTCTFEQINATDYLITLDSGTVRYVSGDGSGQFMVYKTIKTDDGYQKGEPAPFKKITMAELQGDSETVINNIPLGKALHVDKNSHPVLIALAYGEENVDFVFDGNEVVLLHDARTIGDFRYDNMNMLNDIYLSTLIDADTDNSIIMYLLYGKENLHYQVRNGKVETLQRKVAFKNGKVYNEYGEEIPNTTPLANGYQVVENGETLIYRTDKTQFSAGEIEQVEIDGVKITLQQVCDEAGNAIFYKGATVGDLSSDNSALSKLTSRMVLSDIIEIDDSDTILKHIANTPVDKVPDAINRLTIGEAFSKEIYFTNANGEYTDKNGVVVSEENKVMQPMWKYMLTPEGESEPKLDYKLTSDINQMTINMQANIQLKTLNELVEDGIIEGMNTTAFDKEIPSTISAVSGYEKYAGKTLGDLNIHGLIDLMTLLTVTW